MIDLHLLPNCLGASLKLTIAILLVACLPLSLVTASAQEEVPADPKAQTLKFQVVDEEGSPIEGASLKPTIFAYQREGRNSFYGVDEPRVETDEQGEATFVFPVGDKGPILRAYLWAHHTSFLENASFLDIADEGVTVTLRRGLRVAASALDPVTKKPIKAGLYVMPNKNSRVDWIVKTNGTLISPVLGDGHTSLRLVQLDNNNAIRFSRLIDILPRDKSRLRFSNIEMVDALTITGELSDDVPRPVKAGMVNFCVTSVSQNGQAPDPRSSWYWKSFSKVNEDGTFMLEGIPTDSVLQVHCACRGWANKPPTRDRVLAEFPKEANNNFKHPLPQLFQTGQQDSEITVAMQPLGSVTVKVVDQDDKPFQRTRAKIRVYQKFFYSSGYSSYDATLSSARRLAKLRSASTAGRIPENNLISDLATPLPEDRTGFQTEFSYGYVSTGTKGSAVIDGIPAGEVRVTVSTTDGQRLSKQAIVKSNENVDVEFTLNRTDPENGGDDD